MGRRGPSREGRAQAASDPPATTLPVPRIFGFEGADAEDVIYVNWLNMVRAGLLALEFYTPEASNWRQVGPWGLSGVGEPELGARIRILGAGMGQPTRHMNWVSSRTPLCMGTGHVSVV